MLELRDITYTIQKDGEDLDLLHNISLTVKDGHFMAVVGPSGCGKTTLMKVITGLQLESSGEIWWRGKDLGVDGEMLPNELGYVPQFSIAYDHLTVEECIENAIRLRVKGRGGDDLYDLADSIIAQVGMESMREKRVKVLSGGQKRRLGLAMELVSNPTLLLCDEVTSGLDPKSEREIVHLMHDLSRKNHRIVLNITHSLANLELYDSVLVLHEGRVVYHGPPDAVAHYFSVDSVEDVYPRLAKRSAERWHESWSKYRGDYYALLDKRHAQRQTVGGAPADGVANRPAEPYSVPAGVKATPESPPKADNDGIEPITKELLEEHSDDGSTADGITRLPGALKQFFVLLGRRWTLFFRDRTQLVLQLILLFVFPCLVVIFAPSGIKAFPDQSPDPTLNFMEQAKQTASVVTEQTKIGGLISGLVMFQVILLTLMGSNNAAREIAGERLIYEKERLGGLRPFSYLSSKIAFLGVLVLAQAAWMCLFVDLFCKVPGEFLDKLKLLIMVNSAMTFVCLGISAAMKSADQASLLSIYLVGFQLPLSGAVLKMPSWLEPITQPIIAAYWSWSGQMQAVSDAKSKYELGIKYAVSTYPFPSVDTALLMLLIHTAVGLIIAYIFCKRRIWD